MKTYLGVDGGGTKTAFALIDESGRLLASHTAGPAYYLQIGLEHMRVMLTRGIEATLTAGGVPSSGVTYAFLGLPAYGEDSSLISALDSAASPLLSPERYRCGNDAVCGWAGALACEDGINIVAGTGSIVYGEFESRRARAGGWGELFSDEGSAHWIAREGLRLFSRMSDGRTIPGALHDLVRKHFGLRAELDLCAAIYGQNASERSELATLAKLVATAAEAGDTRAVDLFIQAADELVQMVEAVRDRLQIPPITAVPVSYSGGMFQLTELFLRPLQSRLTSSPRSYRLEAPRLPPVAGAALYAAKLSGNRLSAAALDRLSAHYRS